MQHPGRRGGQYRARVEAVAEQAGQLAASQLGGMLPPVQIILTDSAGLARFTKDSDLQLAGAGAKTPPRQVVAGYRDAFGSAGYTAVTVNGIVVVINAPKNPTLGELDKTLVHEFAHAVQLGSARARQEHTAYVRQGYGIEAPDQEFRARYERQIDIREQQARNLEVLARRLPAPAES